MCFYYKRIESIERQYFEQKILLVIYFSCAAEPIGFGGRRRILTRSIVDFGYYFFFFVLRAAWF